MLDQYLQYIEQLPDSRELRRDDLINPDFLIEKENNLQMYYSPHNEYINYQAKIVIVGIAPGWTQMKRAFETFVALKAAGNLNVDRILEEAKKEASFSGTMRLNLIHMLDEIKLHDALGLPGTSCIFEDSRSLLHTTSMIKHPVFFTKIKIILVTNLKLITARFFLNMHMIGLLMKLIRYLHPHY